MKAGCVVLISALCLVQQAHAADVLIEDLDAQFARQVDHQLNVPVVEQQRYIGLIKQALVQANHADFSSQIFVVIDRSPVVQAAFLLLLTPSSDWHWVGATAVSTGKPGSFEHFISPFGVFRHTPDNPDFRSAGTYNQNHIRGYGARGMRVFDFGWQTAERGWGVGGNSPMRLAMHATDPERLEARFGSVASEGCIRIPAKLNTFLDHYGVLDADYEIAQAGGITLRVLRPDRQPLPWPGRFLVVIDSETLVRPLWSPSPSKP
jgi:hypothetical protein